METTTNAENETVVVLRKTARQLARSAPVKQASLSEIDVVFTDLPFADDLMSKCREWGTEVRVASIDG